MLYLSELTIDDKAELITIMGPSHAKKRLSDLGLTPGTKIQIRRKAAHRGPIVIQFRGGTLVIGYKLASKIQIKKYHD